LREQPESVVQNKQLLETVLKEMVFGFRKTATAVVGPEIEEEEIVLGFQLLSGLLPFVHLVKF
jgi:hypothetical protein